MCACVCVKRFNPLKVHVNTVPRTVCDSCNIRSLAVVRALDPHHRPAKLDASSIVRVLRVRVSLCPGVFVCVSGFLARIFGPLCVCARRVGGREVVTVSLPATFLRAEVVGVCWYFQAACCFFFFFPASWLLPYNMAAVFLCCGVPRCCWWLDRQDSIRKIL